MAPRTSLPNSLYVLLPLLVFAACKFEQNLGTASGASFAQVVQPADLPVPREFRLRSEAGRSRSYEHGLFRSAHLEYRGHENLDRLREKMLERLPTYGWDYIQEDRPTGERLVQRWIRRVASGVQYLLAVEMLRGEKSTRLVYDLRTRRAPAMGAIPRGATVPAAANKGSSQK